MPLHSLHQDNIREILMKRYAVEKTVSLLRLFGVLVIGLVSFLLFQLTWIGAAAWLRDPITKFFLLMAALSGLAALWLWAWKIIGKQIPKLVLIGMLGWIFIIVNITPNLIIGDKWGVKENNSKIHRETQQKQLPLKEHSISMPLNRFLNLSDNEMENLSTGTEQKITDKAWLYIDSFFFPFHLLDSNSKDIHRTKKITLSVVTYDNFKMYVWIHIGLFVVLFSVLFLNISTYRERPDTGYGPLNFAPPMGKRFWKSFYRLDHHQRERNTKKYLAMICLVLLTIAYFSLNYFILFWILSFIGTILLFRWEILEHGQSHKPWSRSILFVILTQVFSAVTGEILFLVLLPLYTDIGPDYHLVNLADTIILGWLIFLGSSVTVFIGIVTQVIWSGHRITERMRNR